MNFERKPVARKLTYEEEEVEAPIAPSLERETVDQWLSQHLAQLHFTSPFRADQK